MLGVNFSDNKIFFLYFNLLSNSISPFKIELIKILRQNYHEFYKHKNVSNVNQIYRL